MNDRDRNLVQCLLTKETRYQVLWIRENAAVVGNIVELVGKDSRERGWRIVSAGTRLPEAYLRERSRDHLHTRKASDA